MEFLNGIDGGADGWFSQLPSWVGWLKPILFVCNWLGDWTFLAAITVVAILLLLSRQRYRSAMLVALTVLSSWAIVLQISNWVQGQRSTIPEPPLAFTDLYFRYCFPSDHALGATTVYPLLALLAAPWLRSEWQRTLLIGSSFLLVFLIGFSQLYFRLNLPTDVIAGWACGLGLSLTCYLLDKHLCRRIKNSNEEQGLKN